AKFAGGRVGVGKKREELAALLSSSPLGSGAELTTVSFSQSVSALAEWMGGEEKNDRVELGFRGLNDSIGGILKNGVFVLSGRSGHGKTDFALNMALQMAKRGNRVLYFSMEMSAVQVAERYVANITRLDKGRIHKKLLSPEEMVLVEDAKDWLGSGWLHTVEEARISTGKIRRYIEEYHPDVIFVDHLGLMERGTSRDPYRALGEVTNELKVIALEKKVAIVELVQMNRQIEGRQEKIPNLSDLRESGDIEQDADYVAFLVRSGEACSLSGGGWMDVRLFLEKNRHGPMGNFAFHWQPQYSRYVERQ
ncbi:MAG: DnaB-like helicase C-terminal domain-containing protein, partial [Oscillospiraceae bacterium]